MNKIKEFILKYKIILLIVLLVIASFGIYFFASAEEDIYANQIEVTNAISKIVDGTPNEDGSFDPNDDAGNDSSNSNKIVRNFDSITYDVSYNLRYKESTNLSAEDQKLDNIRNAIIDVLLPTSISANVSYGGNSDINQGPSSAKEVTINGINYNYYMFEINGIDISSPRTSSIVVSNINSKNNTKIEPIIRVRESTDQSAVAIDNNTDINNISKLNVEPVIVSAKENYGIKLYPGVLKKDYDNATIPVGVVIYLPKDPNKGIRGIEVPSSVEFNMTINDTTNSSSIIGTPTISNYDSSLYTIDGLPSADATNNGNAGIIVNGNTFTLNFTELKFSNNAVSINDVDVNYLSSKMVLFNVQRTTPKANITYSIGATNGVITSNNIEMNYNYDPYIGDYKTKVEFVNKNGSIPNPGEATYYFNEEFDIKNTIQYGFNGTYSGDNLNGFVNYLKIDEDAIELLESDNISDETKDYIVKFSGTDSPTKDNYSVKYGVGKWDSSYFEISGTCHISSKEDLMNYYGSSCVNDKNIVWYDTIEEAKKNGSIILIQFDYSGDFSAGTSATLTFKARAKNNSSNVGSTFAVISKGITTWNDNTYYLSETPMPLLDSSTGDTSMYYKKTEYDANHNIIANTNNPSGSYGNTLLVSAFKVGFDSIITKNSYDSEKSTIYSGLDDPVEIILTPTLSTYVGNKIESVSINVVLPQGLELYIKKGDKIPTIDNAAPSYKTLMYSFTSDEIAKNNGKIPNLILHAYISVGTPDNTIADITAAIDAVVSNGDKKYSSITSIDKRTIGARLTLRNTNKINALGTINQTYIDKNGEFTYKMRASNLSSDAATLELLNILPYSGDSIGDGSKFSGTLSVAIQDVLPEGYKIYYTSDAAKTILKNEIDSSEIKWIEWSDYNTYRKDITAIKIVSTSQIASGGYFVNDTGLTLKIKTDGNKETDIYYNNFYILERNAKLCEDGSSDLQTQGVECDPNLKGTLIYPSNTSNVSVYNRTISGKVFEDEDYNGLYEDEKKLSNQIVELYRLNKEGEFDPNNPLDVISDADEKVSKSDVTTDNNGTYLFNSLSSGSYYVKVTFDCDKYSVTDKNKTTIDTLVDTSSIDSDFIAIPTENSNTCSAVSNIITLNNDNINARNIDLGLRIKQNFDIKISKYITNVTINSNRGTQSIDYDKQTKVKIDVKNLKNTSFRVTYNFEIENTKYFPGTIGTIMESIPEGMTFDPSLSENDGWYETSNGTLYYEYLSNTLIMPGEKYHIKIVLDLVTDEGGDFVNIVLADDLRVMGSASDIITDTEIEILPDGETENPGEDSNGDTNEDEEGDFE
ncbi:MAG: hypothetical protein J6B64_00405 [Bacilli bacterium]|nr:hypothetical protein [Bacilli bacterium]MBP3635594.1 hypothetical protein [Bacilli bacterium]